MAEIDEDQRLADKVERLEGEATEYLDALIAYLVLIGDSSREKARKMAMIKEKIKTARDWAEKFVGTNLPKLYSRETKVAYRQVGMRARDLSGAQATEMNNLREDMLNNVNQKIDEYERKARALVLIRERERIRNERLRYDGYEEKRVLRNGKQKKEIVLMDSKGRIIQTSAIVKLIIGDALYNAGYAAKRAIWLLAGYRYGTHISVMDDRTTPICRALNGKRRDLLKDKLPPMHGGCRSKIKIKKINQKNEQQ